LQLLSQVRGGGGGGGGGGGLFLFVCDGGGSRDKAPAARETL
jgi:hypothetical protein